MDREKKRKDARSQTYTYKNQERKDVYDRVEAHKRGGETFSDTVARLMDDVLLLDLVDEHGEYDAERAFEQKDALTRMARADTEAANELSERGS